jgi:hypothetical protein
VCRAGTCAAGPPLNRETYRIPVGFDLIVDYGASNEVCRLQVPALMPTNEKISSASEMKQRMYDFLADLVPDSSRGKRLGRYDLGVGGISFLVSGHERVTITEVEHANDPFNDKNTITVSFKNENCREVRGK